MIKTVEEILSKILPIQGNLITIETAKVCMEVYADQFKPKQIKPIEDRKHLFRMACEESFGQPVCFDVTTLEFFDYWTEHSANSKNMRFEKEKVFDIKKRLERWKRNNFNNGKSTKPTTDEAVNGFISQ